MKAFFTLLLGLFCTIAQAQTHSVSSPDNDLSVDIYVGNPVTYSIQLNGKTILEQAEIGYKINNQKLELGEAALIDTKESSHSEIIRPVTPTKNAEIENDYRELALEYEDYTIRFRVFDNGVAHRLETNLEGQITINDEQYDLQFPQNTETWYPLEDGFFSSNERNYLHAKLDTLSPHNLASLPVLFGETGAHKIILMESGLRDYAGMWAIKTAEGISATFPSYPDKTTDVTDRYREVVTRQNHLAKTSGTRNFPWRIFGVAEKDTDLLSNDLVYQLADESEIDTDWIKPGKVAWDWWNALNLKGVDFESGVNTQTYKYYIDFASAHGIEYVILDEGWYNLGDLLDISENVDVKELIRYGEEKNVGIILWVVWRTLNDQFDEALDAFANWGAKGIKVDFMNRDDQWMVNFYEKTAQAAAERELLVNFHGAYKPSGIRRTYPNVITREGVMGLEYNKWSQNVTPTHNVTIPFIRMVPGPIDFTPGGLTNTQPGNHRVSHFRPMVMGTRAAEVAKFILYESPLQMMADTPTNYQDEEETAQFMASIPTTWDQTIPLAGQVGEFLVTARRKGDTWYIGGMSNEESRELTVDLDFLEDGKYEAEIFKDGINADKHAEDYIIETQNVTASDSMDLNLAPSGGVAIILTKR
ncbi:glycoside hydrolase family 97 protein [Gracilimonas mengyeensis]|uniref:Alpha-glucosidase n=1 Tax=Gracilimonas mengyeensis TaxID=1302730 RepID=A0A521C080_9BACT|nr:glycoside hydrolase family 97 protein [Gracilimonas mengyeensis]SMO52866.1 alpha-glucosidase [Gracilimonas mengyeensis]